MFSILLIFPALLQLATAATHTYNWDIEWVTAAPDGFARPVIGINGQWPCPQVDATIGDRVIFNVYNGLKNQSTGIHWHGLRQQGTPFMDGPSGVAQCPIPPGGRMTYDFVVSFTCYYPCGLADLL
jgi:iron transport multicopper oxidase